MKKLAQTLLISVVAPLAVGLAVYSTRHEVTAATTEPRSWPMTDMEQHALVGIDVLRNKLISDAANACSTTIEKAQAIVWTASSIQASEDAIARSSKTFRALPENVALVRSGATWSGVTLK